MIGFDQIEVYSSMAICIPTYWSKSGSLRTIRGPGDGLSVAPISFYIQPIQINNVQYKDYAYNAYLNINIIGPYVHIHTHVHKV